jgi:hypothetical protein
MLLKTIEQERAEAEAMVKNMRFIGKERRLEHSNAVSWWDDYDMDTTETLYVDSDGKYYLRVEMNHDFILSDGVEKISRAEANEWTRRKARAAYKAPRRRSRQILGTYGKRRYNFWKMVHKHFRKKAQKGA